MQLCLNKKFLMLLPLFFSSLTMNIIGMEQRPKIIQEYEQMCVIQQKGIFFDEKNPDQAWVLSYGLKSVPSLRALALDEKKIKKTFIFDDQLFVPGVKGDGHGNLVCLVDRGFEIKNTNLETVKKITSKFMPGSIFQMTPNAMYVVTKVWGHLEKWHIESGNKELTFSINAKNVAHIALSNTKMLVITKKNAFEYELDGKLVHNFFKQPEEVRAAEYCLANNHKALATRNETIEIYNDTNELQRKVVTASCPSSIMTFSRCGKYIAYGAYEGGAYFCNIDREQAVTLKKGEYCKSMDWSPTNLIAVGTLNANVIFFDVSTIVANDRAMDGITSKLLQILYRGKFCDAQILCKQ